MTRCILLAVLLQAAPATTGPKNDDPAKVAAAADPAEFKLIVTELDFAGDVEGRTQLVFRNGRVYEFNFHDGAREVWMLDPARKAVFFLDPRLQVMSDLTLKEIDAEIGRIRLEMQKSIQEKRKSPDREARLEAQYLEAQVEPKLAAEYDPATHRLKLENSKIKIDAQGAHEDDAARLARMGEAIRLKARLATLYDDDALPFVPIAVVDALAEGRSLRPADLRIAYLLGGPPVKLHTTFEFVPTLSKDEQDSTDLVDSRLKSVRRMPFDRFRRRMAAPAPR